jgi:hypothetical protein
MAFTQLPTGGGVPNVDLITQTLAKLQPDSALQNYARMHKNDPYILSLATAESNRRKALRTAAQGQVGQQPTVADQSIAGMAPAPVMTGSGGTLQTGYGGPVMTGMASGGLPEDQGIAQLSTPNMQYMADGGIAGYEDDEEGMATGGMGGMFNFAQQSEPVVRMSGGGHVPRYQGNTTDGSVVTSGDMYTQQLALKAKYEKEASEMGEGIRREFSPDVKVFAQQLSKSENAAQASYLAQEQKRLIEGSPLRNRAQTSTSTVAPTAPTASAAYDPTENLKKLAQTNAKYTTPSAPKNAEEAAMLNRYPATKPAADKVPPAAATAAGGVTDLLPATQQLDTSYKSVAAPTAAAKAKASTLYDSKGQKLSLEQKRLQAREDIFGEKRERSAQLEAFNKEQGPAFASYEKLLQKEELQDTTDKEKSGLMSLMKGFLAMAAGESPNAATNIAKGAMVGLGDYGDALKEFKKAAKERNKAMADIENARRAEAKGDFKDQRTFEDRAAERIAASDDRFTGLISQITGKEADVAASLLNNMESIAANKDLAGMKEAGLNKRFNAEQAGLNARALMPTGDARTAIMLGSGNTQAERLESGMKKLQEITADKSGMAAVKLLAETNVKLQAAGQLPITMADLLGGAREFSALMYPKVADTAPTRERPR